MKEVILSCILIPTLSLLIAHVPVTIHSHLLKIEMLKKYEDNLIEQEKILARIQNNANPFKVGNRDSE